MTLQVQRVFKLPVEALAEMQTESQKAGFRAIDRLINDWMTETNRFDRPEEALFIARHTNRVIGICGLNHDPYADSIRIGRVRRLYVMQDSRRQGIGRVLVHQVIRAARPSFDWLHVRTTSPIAAQFYQSLGFTTCDREFVSHVLNLTTVHLEEPL
jgi:GNAT superfamily N-acetyltransferase